MGRNDERERAVERIGAGRRASARPSGTVTVVRESDGDDTSTAVLRLDDTAVGSPDAAWPPSAAPGGREWTGRRPEWLADVGQGEVGRGAGESGSTHDDGRYRDDPYRDAVFLDDDIDEGSRSRAWLPERWRGARIDAGRGGAVALIAVALVAAVVAYVTVWRDTPSVHSVPPLSVVSSAEPAPDDAAPTVTDGTGEGGSAGEVRGEVVVSVVGLVHRPGLVRLPPGSRVADALAAAGGTLPDADTVSLNMAQRLGDGEQVVVGSSADARPPVSAVAGATGPGAAAVPGGAGAGLVDLNTADETALDALPGVGPVTAAAIVAWRTAHGRFTDVGQLAEVDGIGPARLAKLRPLVTV
ncbi:ComEA family DNA-binding protein [Rhodococcus sp. HNM0569]|uniref:ComEA family DNA-binding protein n=1 Tax=Rhodococcus sp. HNM0569 TaxID=2716340 RepID=UPI00146BAA2F|nr:ComEA family DNA-binding protein [Rhodococcus sp. HNM0569]NLU84047.1 ComEA family DNA-binding protein [Rhodococcus sp. HNM0569]